MGLSNLQIGGWNVIGGSARAAVFEAGNIWFVDGDNGGSGNPGSGPGSGEALDSISNAVANASRGGLIYVRPKLTVASAQSYYLDNITIPLTKPHISILGCGADRSMPYMGVAIKTTVALNTTPVLTVKSSGFLTEGMEWTGTSQAGDVSVIYVANDGTIALTSGLTVRDCTIRNVKGHAAGTGGGIHFETPIFCKVQRCLFKDNLASIVMRSSSAAINTLLIEDCSFNGANTTRDVDIYSTADGGTGLLIRGCWFNDALPNHGVINRYISFAAGVSGLITECHFAVSAAAADGLFDTAGTQITKPATIFFVRNYYEGSATQEGLAADYT